MHVKNGNESILISVGYMLRRQLSIFDCFTSIWEIMQHEERR